MKRTIPLVVGNWKLNPTTEKEAIALATAVAKAHKKTEAPLVAIAPSFVHLREVQKKISKTAVKLSAQDVSTEPLGAFTGEVSAMQLRDLGVDYAIIGHSERRAMGESDELVQKKALAALKYKITPIVCVGERDRDGNGNFYGLVERQLRTLAEGVPAKEIKKMVIAYEPIWAIGTGKTATAHDVKEMQLFIVSTFTKIYDRVTAQSIKLLYGGSVKPQNALELHRDGGMNGFLVGGASLKAADFGAIISATKE